MADAIRLCAAGDASVGMEVNSRQLAATPIDQIVRAIQLGIRLIDTKVSSIDP
jgi:hypothetical protein